MKLCIFDLDGTLLNTLTDLANAGNHVLRELGLPEHPEAAFGRFAGNGLDTFVRRMSPPELRDDGALMAKMRSIFDAYYSVHDQDFTAPYPGIPETLDALAGRGMTLAVLSNKPHGFACKLVQQYFGDRFVLVQGMQEGRPPKPDGSLIKGILRELGIPEAQTLYIGDSDVDMRTACNGGVPGVGALWGFRGREELLQNGAAAVIETPGELLRILDLHSLEPSGMNQ